MTERDTEVARGKAAGYVGFGDGGLERQAHNVNRRRPLQTRPAAVNVVGQLSMRCGTCIGLASCNAEGSRCSGIP